MSGNSLQGIGIPFFTEEEWHRAKVAMEDANTFHDSYAEFVQAVAQAERNLISRGVAVIRVNLQMDEFIPWCRSTGRKINSEARSHYAAMKARELDKGR